MDWEVVETLFGHSGDPGLWQLEAACYVWEDTWLRVRKPRCRLTWLKQHLLSTYGERWLTKTWKEGGGRWVETNLMQGQPGLSVMCGLRDETLWVRECGSFCYRRFLIKAGAGIGFEGWLSGLWWDITGASEGCSGRQESGWGKSPEAGEYHPCPENWAQMTEMCSWEKALLFWYTNPSTMAKNMFSLKHSYMKKSTLNSVSMATCNSTFQGTQYQLLSLPCNSWRAFVNKNFKSEIFDQSVA